MADLKKTSNIISANDLNWLLSAVIKRWYLFLIIIPIFGLFGAIYNHQQISLYQTKIEILLKSNDVYDYQENLYSNVGFYNYYGDISNQKRILGSYDMLQKVLNKLDLSCSYYIVGRLNTKEFFDELPFKVDVNVLNPKLYNLPIGFKILDNNYYEMMFKIDQQEFTFKHSFDTLETNIHYSINTSLLAKLNKKRSQRLSKINYQVRFHKKQYWINKILNNISINNVEYTSLLVVNLLDEIPNRSKMILDTLAYEYINYTLENQFKINEKETDGNKVIVTRFFDSKRPKPGEVKQTLTTEEVLKLTQHGGLKGYNVKLIIRLQGVWISSDSFGCSWVAEQVKVYENNVKKNEYKFKYKTDLRLHQ